MTAQSAIHGGNAYTLGWKERFMAMMELLKLRMTFHILFTVFIGYYIGSPSPLDWGVLGWTLLGSGLLAGASFCFNQALEKDFDGVMERTQGRPLPSGRLPVAAAHVAGLFTTALGIAALWLYANPLTAALGFATVALYAGVYTPMKRFSTLNTLVGAVPGALPPLMGWAAAQDRLGMGGLILFAVLFFWQLPHFLALAWMYRDDYRRGGFKMLSLVDPTGRTLFRQVQVQSVLLLLVSLSPYWYGLAGILYLITALALGLVLLGLAHALQRSGSRPAAVRLFLFTILYLPALLAILALDKRIVYLG